MRAFFLMLFVALNLVLAVTATFEARDSGSPIRPPQERDGGGKDG